MSEQDSWKMFLVTRGINYSATFVRAEPWYGSRTSDVLNQAVERKFDDHLPPGYLPLNEVRREFPGNEKDLVPSLLVQTSEIFFAYDIVKNLGSEAKRQLQKHVVKSEAPEVRVTLMAPLGVSYVFDGQLIWNATQLVKNPFWPIKAAYYYQCTPKNPPTTTSLDAHRADNQPADQTFVLNRDRIHSIRYLSRP